MRDNIHREHREYIIVVTGCVLRGGLTTPFMYLSDSASQSVQRRRLIRAGSNAVLPCTEKNTQEDICKVCSSMYVALTATSEALYNFIVDIKFMAAAECVHARICCSIMFHI